MAKVTAAEGHRRIVDVLGEIVSENTVRNWFKAFREGRTSLRDEIRSGRPSEIDHSAIIEAVEENCHSSAREISNDLNVSKTSVSRILNQEKFVNSFDQLVPHDLTPAQMTKRVEASRKLLHRLTYDDFLKNLVTTDEKWIYLKDCSRKRSWRRVGETVTQPLQNRFGKKAMLTVFWCQRGLIHYELLDYGKTINAHSYLVSFKAMVDALKQKYPKFGRITYLHDNARPHIAKDVKKFFEEHNIDALKHPPYSPDLSPSDYHLFRSLQHHLSGKNFINNQEVKCSLDQYFASRDSNFWKRGIQSLKDRWERCIEAEGKYFDF